jgi:hypothetical protein
MFWASSNELAYFCLPLGVKVHAYILIIHGPAFSIIKYMWMLYLGVLIIVAFSFKLYDYYHFQLACFLK